MKKANRSEENDLRLEYDFATMPGGVRGKYVKQLREESNIVLLDPEAVRRHGGLPKKALHPPPRWAEATGARLRQRVTRSKLVA